MADKDNLQNEVKTMKRHFGGLVSLVKDLKARLETFEKKNELNKNEEVRDIVQKQVALDELIVANADMIKKIDL